METLISAYICSNKEFTKALGKWFVDLVGFKTMIHWNTDFFPEVQALRIETASNIYLYSNNSLSCKNSKNKDEEEFVLECIKKLEKLVDDIFWMLQKYKIVQNINNIRKSIIIASVYKSTRSAFIDELLGVSFIFPFHKDYNFDELPEVALFIQGSIFSIEDVIIMGKSNCFYSIVAGVALAVKPIGKDYY